MGEGNVRRATSLVCAVAALSACGGSSGSGEPPPVLPPAQVTDVSLDLRAVPVGGGFVRVSGSASTGRFGVPVAGGYDCDGDGFIDMAMSNMQASPLARDRAGQALLVFGDGSLAAGIDTALPGPRVLTIAGAGPQEAAAGEIWMDDVTGDGIGDLLIGRPNFREPVSGRIGAGALSVVAGGAELRNLAANGTVLDLAAPPPGVRVMTLVGASELDRLGFWMRSGDVTGDGVADILVGADQADRLTEVNAGEAWLVRGGAHLEATLGIDLAQFGSTALAGHVARITPPAGSTDYHFGATVALADLDGDALSEVLIAASLSRVGGLLLAAGAPAGSAVRYGGNPGGSLFIVWGDVFPAGPNWPAGYHIALDAPPAGVTRIDGGSVAGVFANERFGEELIGGLDYDSDGSADLFVGDITGVARDTRTRAGVGHVFFSAAALRDRAFSMSEVPGDLRVTTLLGPAAGVISSDTSLHGDLDADGIADLVIASPLASPFGRTEAGTVHVLWGQTGQWPALIDLADGARPALSDFAITDIHGANGAQSADDTGDTLMYSAAAADVDGDGRVDMIINEMRGNGVDPATLDVGNMLVISGALVPKP